MITSKLRGPDYCSPWWAMHDTLIRMIGVRGAPWDDILVPLDGLVGWEVTNAPLRDLFLYAAVRDGMLKQRDGDGWWYCPFIVGDQTPLTSPLKITTEDLDAVFGNEKYGWWHREGAAYDALRGRSREKGEWINQEPRSVFVLARVTGHRW